ncbi:non-lysosomal glucosylceramidase [bacterium]|nr:non-lysosomal glucosylceramidase [bacterium]
MRTSLTVVVLVAFFCCVSCSNKEPSLPSGTMVKTPETGDWPVLKRYDQQNSARIAMPVGGIGTGTVSLGGRGDLRDWEIMNRPSKGYIPQRGTTGPFFALFVADENGNRQARVLEGPLDVSAYEGSHGSIVPNHGLPRFRNSSFEAAYPLGQVMLSDPDMPVDVRMKVFNPLIPGEEDLSGMPVAVIRFELYNTKSSPITASVCGSMPNFIGMDGWETTKDWKGNLQVIGAKANVNTFRTGTDVQGIFMRSEGISTRVPQWGTIALTTGVREHVSYRTSWLPEQWGKSLLDFWDDFSDDGKLEERGTTGENTPMLSLAVEVDVPPHEKREVTFYLTWNFPNRPSWTPEGNDKDILRNYYTTVYSDAWDTAEKEAPRLPGLEARTVEFVRALCGSTVPDVVKEAALFNISTLRTQTCFRTADGRFYGWEGSCDQKGCCHGSCTHVWNYEQATAFLFGKLAKSMREVEFGHATDENGLMSFRVNLPLERAQGWGKAAADGQMGCIMKMYRDWQLSGDDDMLRALWPKVRKALEFCWIPGGWDADRDGVMEGCQHNTMDVEYYGPNPQMGLWYLGALRAAQEMARYLGDEEFAATCGNLFNRGSAWIDANLYNGEYYEHKIVPPKNASDIAKALLVGMGAQDPTNPDYQLGSGCLVDQLVGQYMAHVCNLGYLVEKGHVDTTLRSIMKYNYCKELSTHFNCMRSFALGDESALLMASYPKDRPENPFPYFTEVMTGFEYTAAVGMLYEGQIKNGITCIENIRRRYDGNRRSPFDEAECGHHYSRAMASWAGLLALSGFHCSAVEKSMTFASQGGTFFWSNGYAWGTCTLTRGKNGITVDLAVLHGQTELSRFILTGYGSKQFDTVMTVKEGEPLSFVLASQ